MTKPVFHPAGSGHGTNQPIIPSFGFMKDDYSQNKKRTPNIPVTNVSPSNRDHRTSTSTTLTSFNSHNRHQALKEQAIYLSGHHFLTLRWHCLSRALHIILCVELNSKATRHTLPKFLDAINWRKSNRITEKEFTAIYDAWLEHSSNNKKTNTHPSSPSPSPSPFSLLSLRATLITRHNVEESDLDLILGILINEYNRKLIHAPMMSIFSIGICTPKWVSLVEKLFFSSDKSGFGYLTKDDLLFFVLANIDDAKSFTNQTITLDHVASMTTGAFSEMVIGDSSVITLSMFKRYFVDRALGEKVIESCQRGLERIARGFSSHSFPNLWDKAAKHIISEIGSTPPSPLLVFILADVATRWNCEWWCGFEENEQIAVELYLAYKNNLIGNCEEGDEEGTGLGLGLGTDMFDIFGESGVFDRDNLDLEQVMKDPSFNLIYQVVVRYLECFDEAFDVACEYLGTWEGDKIASSLILPFSRGGGRLLGNVGNIGWFEGESEGGGLGTDSTNTNTNTSVNESIGSELRLRQSLLQVRGTGMGIGTEMGTQLEDDDNLIVNANEIEIEKGDPVMPPKYMRNTATSRRRSGLTSPPKTKMEKNFTVGKIVENDENKNNTNITNMEKMEEEIMSRYSTTKEQKNIISSPEMNAIIDSTLLQADRPRNDEIDSVVMKLMAGGEDGDILSVLKNMRGGGGEPETIQISAPAIIPQTSPEVKSLNFDLRPDEQLERANELRLKLHDIGDATQLGKVLKLGHQFANNKEYCPFSPEQQQQPQQPPPQQQPQQQVEQGEENVFAIEPIPISLIKHKKKGPAKKQKQIFGRDSKFV